MLQTTHQSITAAAKRLGMDQAEIDALLQLDALHQFDITLDNGKMFTAFRAQHNKHRGPYKGGIRFHEKVTAEEVQALATLMSLKTAAIGLPLGGGKGGVVVNPKELTMGELEELSRKYVRGLQQHIGPEQDIPAPDVNTNAQIMDWMVDEYEALTGDQSRATFTGKSLKLGGSQGREAATGKGGVIALREYLAVSGYEIQHKPLKIAVQGIGNVGEYFIRTVEAEHADWKIVALSDSQNTIVNPDDASRVVAFKQAGGKLAEYDAEVLPADAIFAQDVDVLVLAALDNAITDNNKEKVHATILLELANGPIDEAAEKYLLQNGKQIIPDIIANAGGVIVSYLEWRQNMEREQWSLKQVNDELTIYMKQAVEAMYRYARQHNTTLKEAAIALAIKRLT